MSGLTLLGLLTSVLFGMYYGAVVAMSVAVLRYARYTRHERTVRTSKDQYPSIRAWCISLVVITTVVMWIWPFEYFTYIWNVLHIKNSDVLLINLVLALVRPAVSLITAFAGVRLYESSRPIRSPEYGTSAT
jgi:hypothetical protein